MLGRCTLLPSAWLLVLLSQICAPAHSTVLLVGSIPKVEPREKPVRTLGAGAGKDIHVSEAASLLNAAPRKVRYRIHYLAPQTEKVYILWALDRWQIPNKDLWPPGAAALKGYPHCEMTRSQHGFEIDLLIPEGSKLDYCFHIVSEDGTDIWDTFGAPHRDYHSWATKDGMAIVISANGVFPEGRAVTRRSAWKPATWVALSVVVLPSIVIPAYLLFKRRHVRFVSR